MFKIDTKAHDDARKLLALHPYNTPSNLCANDAYFHASCRRKYGALYFEMVCTEVKEQAGS